MTSLVEKAFLLPVCDIDPLDNLVVTHAQSRADLILTFALIIFIISINRISNLLLRWSFLFLFFLFTLFVRIIYRNGDISLDRKLLTC